MGEVVCRGTAEAEKLAYVPDADQLVRYLRTLAWR